jgi:hypothetical protein
VARRILKAVKTRQRVVNAVGWQTFLVGLAEMVPLLTDTLMESASSLLGSKRLQTPAVLPAEQHTALPASTASRPRDAQEQQPIPLEKVLEPYEHRMHKMNLPREFVRGLLIPNTELESADEVALQWAGMPNKHERALMHDILEALADAGFLERSDGERYHVSYASGVRDTAR